MKKTMKCKSALLLLWLATLPMQRVWADGNNWMSLLPDNVYITQLSIPGAHDAATSTCSGVFSGVSKTQTFTIDGESTGIIGIDGEILETEGHAGTRRDAVKVYNMNGQYVGSDVRALRKGIYVVGGKKMVVK